ncbi:MAG: prepilin-type N-terminal cleavage/methylation domain-containing protein [Magnetococcales bacterium]|nr:prepilin-type N-terminal cleavage/methylation domain-containing protein [Magnetococcales bacterium]
MLALSANPKRPDAGFSLVELAIVLVIIGLIVSAVAVGNSTMEQARAQKHLKRCVVPTASVALAGGTSNADCTGGSAPTCTASGATTGGGNTIVTCTGLTAAEFTACCGSTTCTCEFGTGTVATGG